METTRKSGLSQLALRVGGAGLLIATGAVHLDLYLTGYRSIPTIGGLFLLQVIAAFVLGLVVLASGSRLASAAGAGFALSTLGGYLLTLWIGLFGFREVRTVAGIVAGVIEIGAFAALAALALVPRRPESTEIVTQHSSLANRLQAGFPGSRWAIGVLAVLAAAVLSTSAAVAGPSSTASPGALLKIGSVGGVKVLTNSRGFTLYWFAPDTPTKSNCNGACAAYWPPVTGTPSAAPGVTGKLGTIRRSNGESQATYGGHPLYTYVGDAAPGQAHGNNLNVNGGLWHEMAASG